MAKLQKKCSCPNKDTCPHRWYERVQRDGVRRWIPTGTEMKGAAKRIAEKKRGTRALVAEGFPVEEARTIRLLSLLVEKYLEHAREDHPATADTKDANVLATLLKSIGNIDIATITDGHITTWRSERLQTKSRGRLISRATVNRELNVVRACFRWAEEQGWIALTPVRKVKPWKIDDPKRRILSSPAEYATVKAMPSPYNVINLMTLYFLPRLSEVCALHRNDLSPTHARKPYVNVRRKGGRVDKVFIDPEFMQQLRACLKTPEQQHLFPHVQRRLVTERKRAWTNEWICPANVSNFNTRYFRARGMDGVCNHGMRHTGTTQHLTEIHTDASTLQVMGGWTSRRMLDKYGHATEKSVQTAALAGRAHIDEITAQAAGPLAPVARKEKKSGPQSGPRRVARSA